MIRSLTLSLLAAALAGSIAIVNGSQAPIGAAYAQDAAAEVDTSTIVDMTMGQEDAPVTLIEYASFTCPHCKRFHENVFDDIKTNYIDTGKVRLIYREVYFDRYGLWASMIARCGGEERYFGIAKLIYEQQDTWTRGEPAQIADNLRKIGKTAGMGDTELDACLEDATKAQTLVAWFQENAEADDITSTPSFVIDGKKYLNMNYEEFAAVLDEKLAE